MRRAEFAAARQLAAGPMTDLFTHPVFSSAIADLLSQGVRVSAQPSQGAAAYAIVSARSNARWWLVPLENGRVAAAGLALFQPILNSARAMKIAAATLSLLGLSRLWARQRVYVSGEPRFGACFPQAGSHAYAYFTGTDSPHRKIAVQVMDHAGRLLGFAKVGRSPDVRRLLRHEAAMLEAVGKLNLRSAHVPRVLLAAEEGGSFILVTDTLKRRSTQAVARLTDAHLKFLEELRTATSQARRSGPELAASYRRRLEALRPGLSADWSARIDAALALLDRSPASLLVALSHGDFTPWNTFFASGRLYVFDWEYAELDCPAAIDVLHFALSVPALQSAPAERQLAEARRVVMHVETDLRAIPAAVIAYLFTQVLRQLERLPAAARAGRWDGQQQQAALLDALAKAEAA
jgi:hypothetical protein